MQFDENGMLIIPDANTTAEQTGAAAAAPTDAQAQAPTPAAVEGDPSVLREAWRAVAGGARDALQETGETIQWAGEGIKHAVVGENDLFWTRNDGFEWLSNDEARARDDIPEWQTKGLFEGDGSGLLDLPEVADNESLAGGMARGITQFITGYATLGKTIKLGKQGMIVTGLARGATTDFVAFDAHEDRLSDLVESFPVLGNPVTQYLQAEDDDSILEGKLKNAVEGLGLGVATEGLVHMVKAFKRAKHLDNAGKADEAAAVMAEASEQLEELQLNLFDEASDPNLKGGDAGPKKVIRKGAKPSDEKIVTEAVPAANPVPEAKRAPVNTDAFQRHMDYEMGIVRGGSLPDPNRAVGGDLFNFDTWDSDVEIKDVVNMATDSILAAGTKDRTTFDAIVKDSTKVVSEYIDAGPDVLERSLARMAGDAQRQQAMVVAAKGLLQSLAGEVERLATKIHLGNASDMDMDRFIAMKSRMVETGANLKSVITGAAQTTAAGRIRTTNVVTGQQLAHSEIIRQINDNLADAGGEVDIKRLAKAVLDAKEANGVAGVMRVSEGVVTTGKVLQEYWINSILSGPKTQVANITGNLLMTTILPAHKLLGGAVRMDAGAMREGLGHYAGLKVAIGDALRMAGKAFKEGRNLLDPEAAILEAEGVNFHAIRSSSGNAVVRDTVNWIGTAIRLPSRALTTGDEFFKQLNYRADLYGKLVVQAHDLVQSGKLNADKAGKWVSDRMETGINKDGSARHLESLNAARESTFTNELRQGSFSRGIQNLSNKHPALKMLVPFVRTPTNIIVQFGQHTPGINYLSQGWKEDLAAGGTRAARARGKQVLGSMIWAGAAMAAYEGKITGSGPVDPQARKRLMETGWRPYSFVTAGPDGRKVYTEYKRLDPVAMILGLAADFSEVGGQVDEAAINEFAMAAGISLMNNLGSKSYMTGVMNAVKAAEDPDRFMQQFVNGYASSMVPMSSAMREARKQVDPHMREMRSMLDAIRNTVPGYSEGLPARRSWITGEPIIYPQGWGPESLGPVGDVVQASNPFIRSGDKGDPVLAELATLPGALSAPSRKVDGIELSGEQYERYQELHGTVRLGRYTLHQRLERLFESDRYKRMSRTETDPELDPRTKEARRIITQYRDRAKVQLKREFPQIRADALNRDRDERANRYQPIADLAGQ